MRNKKTVILWIVSAVLLAGALAAAFVLYPALTARYSPEAPEASAESGAELTDAPDFTVYDGEGNAVRLSDQAGKPVMVNFWATWCPPCRSELPYFQEAWERYGDRITFLMVDLTDGARETQAGAEDFLAENGFSFPVYYDLDGSAANGYQLYSIPETVAVNEEGKLVGMQIGALTEESLQAGIDLLLGDND